jgi:hypothetical protein
VPKKSKKLSLAQLTFEQALSGQFQVDPDGRVRKRVIPKIKKPQRRAQIPTIKFSLTPENIARIRDGELSGAMWQYYIGYCDHMTRIKGKRYLTGKESRVLDRSLPRGLRLVHSITRFDGDILNGGVAQYFGNHTPENVAEDLDALLTIGASESARILKKAISIDKRVYGWPAERRESSKVDPWEHPSLERLDELRCNEESSRRDFTILDAYLRQHLDECILPVEVECHWMDEFFMRPKKSRR